MAADKRAAQELANGVQRLPALQQIEYQPGVCDQRAVCDGGAQ